jgi:hypothetical protein
MRKLLLLFFINLISGFCISQNLKILVKKGSAFVSSRNISPEDGMQVLKDNDEVKVIGNSLVLINKNKSVIELIPNKTYSFADINSCLKKSKGFTSSFFKVLSNQDYSLKKQYGSSTRGGTNDLWSYSPDDSLIIVSDSITISVGVQNSELVTDIVIFDSISKFNLVLNKLNNFHKINCPEPGKYFWKCKLKNGNDIKTYSNIFFVPDIQTKKKIISDYKDYCKSIKSFSKEMQMALRYDYCRMNKIYAD